MIKIELRDPGMHPKRVQVRTLAEVPAVLQEHNTTYTTAFVTNTEVVGRHRVKLCKREVGEREWK